MSDRMHHDSSIAFLFVGGPHHIFHAAPVAAELALHAPNARITMLCADEHQEALIRQVLELYDVPNVRILRLDVPGWARLALSFAPRSAVKLPLLFRHRRLLNGFDAIVVPERTSAHIRSMGVRRPKLIHFRHGAGDRAPASERRLSVFDLVVVPGAKDARRAIKNGHLPPERVAVAGYVKFGLIRKMRGRRRPSLFGNDRPTVLYNPHFDAGLSSWTRDGHAVIEAFRAQDDYNLIVAPHIRLFENASDEERMAWEARAEDGKILIDLGSDRSIDMTYTLGSDLYLGDVSSQLYEFIVQPRPCVFLDAHATDWRDNPKYAGWHLGEVVRDPRDVLPAVRRAFGHPQQLADAQRAALADAVGDDYDGAAARGADAVLSYLDRAAA